MPSRTSPGYAWGTLAAWALLIFATVPFARAVQRWVETQADARAFLAVVLVAVLASAAYGWRAAAALGVRARVAVLLGALLYAGAALHLRGNAVEAVHLVEYGALGLLALYALGAERSDALLAPSAALLGAAVGLVDEGLQWLAPDRVWDLRDIGVNALAAALGPALIALGVRPASSGAAPTRASARRLVALAMLVWALLGTSLLNTSARTARLAARFPGSALLAAQSEGMIDYGVRLALPGVGEFPSRLDAAQWSAADASRAESAGEALAAGASPAGYSEFLARYTPARDPFLHELRVHLFRRDRYAETADWHLDDPPWRAKDLAVARREDAFLMRFAPRTLAAAGLLWTDAKRAEATALDPGEPYVSRVAEGVVTRIGEGAIARGWAAGWLALGGALWATRRRA